MSHHVTAISGDDILRKFWELEEDCSNFSPEERFVVQHYANTHTHTNSGRFVVPLPKNPQAKPLGESRSVDFFHWSDHYTKEIGSKSLPQ